MASEKTDICRVSTQRSVSERVDSMDEVFKLRDLIYEETGMYFPDEKKYYFENRFQRRMKVLGVSSFAGYFNYLKNESSRSDELHKLINELAVNETSFFRNQPQFSALQDLVLPELAQSKADIGLKRLKIWSAGCSSGEEAYTIAMILDTMNSDLLKDWHVEVRGTDISKRVIERAREGVYHPYAVRNVPEAYKKKYFDVTGDDYKVKDCLRKYVRFTHFNLNDDMSMVFMKGFDIVFCRNVLIYFDIESKKRVIQHFFNSLVVGGYLFIGFSESLFGISDRFKLIHFPGGMVYRKVAHI